MILEYLPEEVKQLEKYQMDPEYWDNDDDEDWGFPF